MTRPQWDGQPVRVPTLAEVVARLEGVRAFIEKLQVETSMQAHDAEVAMVAAEESIDALKTIDGALADVAHEANKIRGQR